jgi:hypothetical protein
MGDTPADDAKLAAELLRWMRSMPRSTDNLSSTWNPPDWDQVVDWWDQAKDMAEGK